jgi:hypothetical protein
MAEERHLGQNLVGAQTTASYRRTTTVVLEGFWDVYDWNMGCMVTLLAFNLFWLIPAAMGGFVDWLYWTSVVRI